jgi:hypothetical protein
LRRSPAPFRSGFGDDADARTGACHPADALEAAKTNTHLHLRTQAGCLAFDMILQRPARHADEGLAEKVCEPHLIFRGQRMLSGRHDNETVDREGPHGQMTRLDRA